jgi:hypothetical protein
MPTLIRRVRDRVARTATSAYYRIQVPLLHRKVDRAKVDPRISYPCYKALDDHIDVQRLKSLDGYITERVEKHLRDRQDELFRTGAFKMDRGALSKPGSRIIYLSRSERPFSYFDLSRPELWERTPEAEEFSLLMEFIETLPFKAKARMMIMYDGSGKPVTAHRDHTSLDVCHEFIWFRTNLSKPFYMMNRKTGQKKYVESHSAWFDTCNQFHGADAREGLSVSLRVDGLFNDALRSQIPVPAYNLASTPALWACASTQGR